MRLTWYGVTERTGNAGGDWSMRSSVAALSALEAGDKEGRPAAGRLLSCLSCTSRRLGAVRDCGSLLRKPQAHGNHWLAADIPIHQLLLLSHLCVVARFVAKGKGFAWSLCRPRLADFSLVPGTCRYAT